MGGGREHSLHDPIRDNTDKTSPEANLPHSSKTLRPFARYRRLCRCFLTQLRCCASFPENYLINNTREMRADERAYLVVDVRVKLGKRRVTPTNYSRRFFVGFWYEFRRRY